MRISQLLQEGMEVLKAAGIEHPEPDIHLLLGRALQKNRTELFLDAKQQVSEAGHTLFLNFLARRQQREPTAYILGEREFWSRSFHVSRDVLIPRPETEFLLETVFSILKKEGRQYGGPVVDVCCGSGVIAVILALELNTEVLGIELSGKALGVARKNLMLHRVEDRVSLVQGDLLQGLLSQPCVSLIVSNPPYVSENDLAHSLEPEVAEYEPYTALDGGAEGLEIIQQLRVLVRERLLPGGLFFMEIGADQGRAVKAMFSDPYGGSGPFDRVEIKCDYAGRDRVLVAGLDE